MVLQDGCEVRLGDVVREGAVADDVASRCEFGMPLGDAEGQRLCVPAGDLLVEVGDQRPSADGIGKGAYLTSKAGSSRALELDGKVLAKGGQVKEGLFVGILGVRADQSCQLYHQLYAP